jgi:hypothetical protein
MCLNILVLLHIAWQFINPLLPHTTRACCSMKYKIFSCAVRTYVRLTFVVSRLIYQFLCRLTCLYFAVCILFLQFVGCYLYYAHGQGCVLSHVMSRNTSPLEETRFIYFFLSWLIFVKWNWISRDPLFISWPVIGSNLNKLCSSVHKLLQVLCQCRLSSQWLETSCYYLW